MKLRDEDIRSYIDDVKMFGLLEFLTWRGMDVAPTWQGAYQPATRSNDSDLCDLCKFNRAHYLFHRALIERHVEREGRILDAGCGAGSRTTMLRRYAKSVVAIDSDMLKIAAGAYLNTGPDIEWVFDDILSWSKNEGIGLFDYIFAIEVIEHIPLDLHRSFIATLAGLVKPGGALLMTTPRDKNVERKPPHIGLWEDELAERGVKEVGAELSYFNVRNLDQGGEDPWSEKDESSHYVVVCKR
jgi:SAM-dependent methyltransferase